MMKTVWVLSEDGSDEPEKVFTHKEDAVTYEYSLVAREYPYCDTQFTIHEVQYYENSWRTYLESILETEDTIQAYAVIKNLLANGGAYKYDNF
jgi:hypothetical protein